MTTLFPGARLGPYEVLAKIGAGGMGEVYRALDVRLKREVAIKVLGAAFPGDAERLARFEREAQLLAQLQHPNVAAIFGLEESAGAPVLVMELVEGPTLAERLESGALELEEALAIARQVAEALAAAHEKGIVHRDLKPQNIKAPPAGRVKVLDFGLAKRVAFVDDSATLADATTAAAADPAATRAGVIQGSASYMAPEQARSEPIDRRADVWSFGVVLYEMLTGERLFAGGNVFDVLTSVVARPIDFSRLPQTAPPRVAELLRRCLERDLRRRLPDLGEARRLLEPSAITSGTTARRLLAALQRGETPSVAVLPFVNLSANPEDELFADGLTEDVIAHLAKIRSLRVISRTSVMAYKSRRESLREIGVALGATTLLEGSVRRAGNRVRIVAQLIDRDHDEHLWAETYDRDLHDIFAIQTDVALRIAAALRSELSADERARIGRFPTHDLEAYQLYLRGRQYLLQFTVEGVRRAVDVLVEVIERDPGFALAHAALAHAYAQLVFEGVFGQQPEEAFGKAKAAVARALELDDRLAEAHGVAGLLRFTCDYDWAGAERALSHALELAPGNADLFDYLGWLYASQERYDEALQAVRRARELDPLAHRSDVANMLLRAGRHEEARVEAEALLATDPGFPRAHSLTGWAYLLAGDAERGLAALARANELSPGSSLFLAQLGEASALAGQTERAREILAELHRLAQDRYVSPYHFAYVHAGLGEAEAAVEWLERAYEQRAGATYGIKGSYLFRSLRGHPRFVALLAKMNLA